MSSSILTDIKKVLGLVSDYTEFDLDVILHTNTAFAVLNGMGIGPDAGFMIEDNTATWDAFIGTDLKLNPVKTYVYLSVKLLFDPPTSGFVIDAMNKQLEELAWRLNVKREGESWTDPNPPTTPPTVPCWWENF